MMAKSTKGKTTQKKSAKTKAKAGKKKTPKGKTSKKATQAKVSATRTLGFHFGILLVPNSFNDVDLELRDDGIPNERTPVVDATGFDDTPFGNDANAAHIGGPTAVLLKLNPGTGQYEETGNNLDMTETPAGSGDYTATLNPIQDPGTYKALARTLWQVTLEDASETETL